VDLTRLVGWRNFTRGDSAVSLLTQVVCTNANALGRICVGLTSQDTGALKDRVDDAARKQRSFIDRAAATSILQDGCTAGRAT
jgi:hypothetical protein